MDLENTRIGEVVEATTTSFITQSYELWQLPSLGSLIKTGNDAEEYYGIVCRAVTQGVEPGRRAVARGKDSPNTEAIFRENPQLERLLKSEFTALVVGFKDEDSCRQYLPPRPARIHTFVHSCTANEIQKFSAKFDFLSLILRAEIEIPPEELIAATLREMATTQSDRNLFLSQAGRELARLMSKDYGRLRIILEGIRP